MAYLAVGGSQPNATWSSAALMRCVKELIVDAPWGHDAFRRSVWLTSAFARLAERAVPADAVLRTCLAPSLCRRIGFEVATAWSALRRGDYTIEDFPEEIRDWLTIFDAALKAEHADTENLTLEDAIVEARTGDFHRLLQNWCANTAIAHVIAWRYVDRLVVEVLPQDAVVPGGKDATVWTFERFAHTYVEEWSTESLLWESAFIDSPSKVSTRAGVPHTVLRERMLEAADVHRELTRRYSSLDDDAYVIGGANVREVQEQLVHLARTGDLVQALDLARAAYEKNPRSPELKNAFAFFLVPSNPGRSLELFDDDALREATGGLNLLNMIACRIRTGSSDVEQLAHLAGTVVDGHKQAWLWTVDSLRTDIRPLIQFCTVSEWLVSATAMHPSESAPERLADVLHGDQEL